MKIYKKKKTRACNSLATFRLKKVKVQINGRLEAAHKIIMEISLLIMEKSWNNHGILILNFCGNPGLKSPLAVAALRSACASCLPYSHGKA